MAQAGWQRQDAIQKEAGRAPRYPSSASGQASWHKIKLRSLGYRLVYEVRDQELVVLVVAIGKRDRNAVYNAAEQR